MRLFLPLILSFVFCLPAHAQAIQPTDLADRPAEFAICANPDERSTSAGYLRATARCAFGKSAEAGDLKRISLIEDIYIKSWSYMILNKICFWMAVGLAVLVLIWPALGGILKPEGEAPARAPRWLVRATSMASVQTSITALAALTFAFYAHYKSSQMQSENLMRQILYAKSLDQDLIETALAAIRDMDGGFSFAFTPAEGE